MDPKGGKEEIRLHGVSSLEKINQQKVERKKKEKLGFES